MRHALAAVAVVLVAMIRWRLLLLPLRPKIDNGAIMRLKNQQQCNRDEGAKSPVWWGNSAILIWMTRARCGGSKPAAAFRKGK